MFGKFIIAMMIATVCIGVWGVINLGQRTEECHRQNGMMINTPRGNTCVLGLTTVNTRPN